MEEKALKKETEKKIILYQKMILTNDNKIRIPQKILEKLEIPNKSQLEVYEFKNFIILQKTVKPNLYDLTSKYLSLQEAIKQIKAKNEITKALKLIKAKRYIFEELPLNKKKPRPRNPYKEPIKNGEVYTTKA